MNQFNTSKKFKEEFEGKESIPFSKLKDKFYEHLYIEDDYVIDVIFATIIANRFAGDPVWLFFIAPPGGSKSEILRSLRTCPEVIMLSSLTENTLISGFKAKTDPSLLPKLDGKILVVKDFTAVLAIHSEARAKIVGDLRDAYDGESAKSFGTGETKSYISKFGLIAGVTPVIDKHWSVQAELGERFLRFRIQLHSQQKAIQKATANTGKEKVMRAELSNLVQEFLSSCGGYRIDDVKISDEINTLFLYLANLLALGRSRVSRDRFDDTIDFMPTPEIGTRIVKQLKLLAIGHACIHEQSEVNEQNYQFIKRIVRDTLPSKEGKIIQTMFGMQNEYPAPTSEVGKLSGFPTDTCKKVLEDFRLLNIVDREGDKIFKWQLKGNFWELCETTGLFVPF